VVDAILSLHCAGESYAGIYVPTLAYAVVQYNRGKPATPINLKGIMVGNGCLGTEVSQPINGLHRMSPEAGRFAHDLVPFPPPPPPQT